LSEPLVRRTGRPPGMKPVHGLVAIVLAVAWFGTLGYVLTHGHGSQSAVDVYSELPPGFTGQLQAQGVKYQGLSPVDGSTVQQVLAHASANGGAVRGGSGPIVLRTSFSDTAPGHRFTDQAALMVVVPSSQGSAGTGPSASVYVAFLDPTSYRTLASLTYGPSGGSG
jgi:hypothetical protein